MSDTARHLHPVDDQATQPLADDAAEQATLGAALLSAAVAEQIHDTGLIGDDFHNPRHGMIWAAITRALTSGTPTDPIAITAALATQPGDLPRAGGAPYLHTLVNTVPLAANGPHYAARVADLSARRRLADTGIRITQLAHQLHTDTTAVVDRAQALLHQATVTKTGTTATTADLIDPVLADIAAAADGRTTTGLSTGLGSLDDVIGGLTPGQLVIVAARPSMGKSLLLLDMARAAARRGAPTLEFSLEMSSGELIRRLISAVARVDLAHLITGRLSMDELADAYGARDTIASWPLVIDDTADATLAAIRSAARRTQQRHGLALLLVDYLQLMGGPTRGDANRATEVGEISRGLKLLAKELAVPVVAAAQLNRNAEARADKRPALADLRESGSLEQDADVVILLHRDDYYNRESPRAGEADLIVAKNRNGPTDTVAVAAQLEFARFVDLEVPR